MTMNVNLDELDRELPSGKWKGNTVGHVFATDPGYLWWCLRELEGFTSSPIMRRCVKEAAHRQRNGKRRRGT